MSMQRNPSSRRDDTELRIVSHRLQVTGGASRPATEAHARVNGHGATSTDSPQVTRNKRLPQVVLVDRDVDALRDVAVALREHFDFHVTISGHEALNLLQAQAIDVIVVGQTLYSSTGINVLAEAKRRAPRTQRVLLASAAEATDIDRISAPAQPFRILERPCTPQKLRDLLRSLEAPADDPPPAMPASFTPVYHGDYEHVVLETPPEPRRRTARSAPATAPESLPIVVYTDNGDFYHAICAALQERHDIRLATQLNRVIELAETGACPILITDCAGTQTELQRISIAVRAAEPSVVTIASGTPNQGLALRQLLNTPALHSFLPKPLSPPLVRLTVEAAMRHYRQSKAPPAPEPEPEPATPSQTGPRPPSAMYRPLQSFDQDFEIEDRFDYRRFAPYALAAAAVIGLIVAGSWYWQVREKAQANLAVMIDAELELAERAYQARDYTAPENANALYFYRRVLERDPKHPRALQGIDNIAERIIEQTEQQLLADQLDAAAQSIALLSQVRPDHKRLTFLQGQLAKAKSFHEAQKLAERSVEQARAEVAKASAAQAPARAAPPRSLDAEPSGVIATATQRAQAVNRWLALGRQRLNQGRLVAPEDDNAEHYFRLAERADPNNTTIEQGLREIGTKLLAEAQAALARQQLDLARRHVNDAMRFGPDPALVQRINSEIEAAVNANVRNNFLRLALQRTRENALFEPPQDNAKFYLGQLQRLDRNSPETQQALRALALKLIDNANQATTQKQFNTAIRLIDEARRLGFDGEEIKDAQARLELARNPPSAPSKNVTPPRLIKSVPPKYPEEAQLARVSGWVDVGFKISAEGDVYDAVAMASSPPGPYAAKFERAAIAAISQYKFERRPITDTQTQTMVVRVQFKLE